MAFAVIPALDVAGGRLAQWSAGGTTVVEAFGGDPVAAAGALATRGADRLHVVDLTLAFEGWIGAIDVIRAIRRAVPDVQIQVSGGITSMDLIREFLAAGADRTVVSSSALADEVRAEQILQTYGGAVLVGIEVEGGAIRARGREPVELDLMSTLGWLAAARTPGVLVTSVARVGGLAGPDVETVRRVVRSGIPVLAAGGIASLEDLRSLRAAGAIGAVVGRAVLDGTLDLSEALDIAARP